MLILLLNSTIQLYIVVLICLSFYLSFYALCWRKNESCNEASFDFIYFENVLAITLTNYRIINYFAFQAIFSYKQTVDITEVFHFTTTRLYFHFCHLQALKLLTASSPGQIFISYRLTKKYNYSSLLDL